MSTSPTPPKPEQLHWHPVAQLPDSETTVLLWFTDPEIEGDPGDWCAGWWDGEAWRDCSHGGVVDVDVTHWAEPNGPNGGFR